MEINRPKPKYISTDTSLHRHGTINEWQSKGQRRAFNMVVMNHRKGDMVLHQE